MYFISPMFTPGGRIPQEGGGQSQRGPHAACSCGASELLEVMDEVSVIEEKQSISGRCSAACSAGH